MRFSRILSGVLLAGAIAATGAIAQEHPREHPTGRKTVRLTKETLAQAIERYVDQESRLKGGYFLVYDAEAKAPLVLKLKLVHKERLATIGEGVYFACADFTTPEGKVYDLDIFMKGSDPDHLTVTQITVHKEEGKPRYTWYEEDGVWKMRPVGRHGVEHPKGKEHPEGSEHPSEHPQR
jgi:hypothetical protein